LPRLHWSKVTNSRNNPGSEPEPRFEKHKTRKPKGHAKLCPADQPSPIRAPLPPSPWSSRPRPPPPPEAAPPPPHDLWTQRYAAASLHPAARGSAQADNPSLIRPRVCAPSRPRDPLYHTSRGATAGKKQRDLSGQLMVPQRVTFRVLEGFSNTLQHVCGPHLSSHASLPEAPRCELCEVAFNG